MSGASDGAAPGAARPPPARLILGEDLALLRWLLPQLGASLVVAGVAGGAASQLRPLAAVVVAGLGLAAATWALWMTTWQIVLDAGSRQVEILVRRAGGRMTRTVPFEQVEDVVLRVVGSPRGEPESSLGATMAFHLSLVAAAGEWPLSRLPEPTLEACEAQDRRIWEVLGRTPPGAILVRSYCRAIARRDRIQAIWLARLLTPHASLGEAEARVRRDWERP